MNEGELIASRYHGGLAVAHLIAALFNLRKKRYGHAAVHAAFLVYDVACAVIHQQDADGRYETYRDS